VLPNLITFPVTANLPLATVRLVRAPSILSRQLERLHAAAAFYLEVSFAPIYNPVLDDDFRGLCKDLHKQRYVQSGIM
jgi:hypothetical protein